MSNGTELLTKLRSLTVQQQEALSILSELDSLKVTLHSTEVDKNTEQLKSKLSIFKDAYFHALKETDEDLSVIKKLSHVLEKEDIKMTALDAILDVLCELKEFNTLKIRKVFELLSNIPPVKSTFDECSTFYPLDKTSGLKRLLKLKKLKRSFSTAWIDFVKLTLPANIHKQCLQLLPLKIMPHVKEPVMFAEFFFKSYDLGSPFNILALNGLFVLIVKHNLDYPEFFKQIYNLLTSEIYDLDDRDTFFSLLDTFLCSLHIPAYLVAAFIKRLSRLAISAPADVVLIILTLLKNWMIRHANMDVLANRISIDSVGNDPFDMNQQDPALCKAIESSLWEIKTLQSHYLVNVVRKATFINKPSELIEDPLVQKSLDTILCQHLRKSIPDDVPAAFVPPTSLFRNHLFDDCFVE